VSFASGTPVTKYFGDVPFADTKLESTENHMVLDFQVGREVGLGMLGLGGRSNINLGIRFAQLGTSSKLDIHARPIVNVRDVSIFGVFEVPYPSFYQYTMHANASRSVRGVGPSLSWNASTDLIGDHDHAELTFDWGINGALLFGRQKAKTNHATQSYYLTAQHRSPEYLQPHPPRYAHGNRSRSVVVPNLGGFAGFSVRYPNAKLSLGYRADFFFDAMDTGIDVRQTKDLGFHGPFATISIGLGG
jgi:hypothetical protein